MGLRRRHLLALLAAFAVPAALLPTPAAAATWSTVTTGLDSPRGVAFYNGKLLVGEAGHGGPTCFPVPIAGGEACVGDTSQISWVNLTTGAHSPLVTHLYSLNLGEEGTLGVSGISVSEGRILAQIGGTPREDPTALAQQQAGRLISVHPNGTWTTVAEVGKIDFDYTLQFPQPPGPGTQEHDSNPYGVLATDEGALVADAGSNTLDRISEDGKVKILVHDPFRFSFRYFPSDAVPTCVVDTEEGLFVGELSGRVLKVHGSTFSVINDPLLTHITGCATDGRHIYFVNMFGSGAPFTPPPDSNFFIGNVVTYNVESGKASVLVPGLQFPNMDTIGPDGNLYVSAGSICGSTPVAGPPCFGATGTVLKVTLPHGDADD